jgi:uncharacterized membrane protein YdjX (TVP38/TMEM64 family)
MDEIREQEKVKFSRLRLKWYWILLAALYFIGVAASLVIIRDHIVDFQQYGYLGAFLISLVASATVVFFIPSVPVIFALGGILNPFFIGLAAGLGEGIGEFTGYFAGRSGRAFFKNSSVGMHSRLLKWIKGRGFLTIFISSSIFNPLSSVVGATAGASRYPVWKFFIAVWAGKTLKWTVVAIVGQGVLVYILRWLGVTL